MLGIRLGSAEVRFTERADGDFRATADAAMIERARRAVVARPWRTVTQVHGSRVVRADASTDASGVEADALVTTDRSIAIAVKTADCPPVALAADGVDAASGARTGVLGVVHAGWRGLMAGIVDAAVAEMRACGAGTIEAALGPCIHPECYEFGGDDLDAVADRFGDDVRSTTQTGSPALDLRAAVRAALGQADVALVHDADACTACDATAWWSHRARGEIERQATVAWLS